ncbi:hypothetical protein J2W37_001261 [Variovorax paradoxus]|uniref:hypothetical protein n=1 Tax=Variovorax paradoxus TaxID=34073 RepID=UPI002784BFDD|nr:hypothetical protein [Variovorax paradoxus]MDP9963550.1 hypothetical protein [Variovorax paradoxus]
MANASQLPDLNDVPVYAKTDPNSPMPGFVTFAHLAARAGVTPNHLRVTLSDENAPKLLPTQRIGGMYLYSEQEADRWFLRFQEWRDAAPLRAAARKLEQEQRVLQKLEEDQKRYKQQQEADAALKKMQDEFAARNEALRKEQEETNRRVGLL